MNTARKVRNTHAASLETGVVEFVGQAAPRSGPSLINKGAPPAPDTSSSIVIQVTLSVGTVEATLAKGCLVTPEVGDKVLCAMDSEEVFVISVLSSENTKTTSISAQGDLLLRAPSGKVSVAGASGVDIASAGPLGFVAPEVHVHAKKGSIAVEELGFFGRLLQAEIAKVALVADEVDSVLNRLSQRAKRVFRFTEELDQTRAGTVDIRAQKMLGLRAENAVLSARVLAKVDGEQIHLG